MNAFAFAKHIDEFLYNALVVGFASDTNSHIAVQTGSTAYEIRASGTESKTRSIKYRSTTLEGYLLALQERNFSSMLFDGSILQIATDIHGSDIVKHRYAYIPCPVQFEISELGSGEGLLSVSDYIELLAPAEIQSRFRSRGSVRFEFDPKSAGEFHPASHLHLGISDCRIAVDRPLSFDQFIRFVVLNFYPEFLEKLSLDPSKQPKCLPRYIEPAHLHELHVSIVEQISSSDSKST